MKTTFCFTELAFHSRKTGVRSEADNVEKKTLSMMHGKVRDPPDVVVFYGKLFNQLSHDTSGRDETFVMRLRNFTSECEWHRPILS